MKPTTAARLALIPVAAALAGCSAPIAPIYFSGISYSGSVIIGGAAGAIPAGPRIFFVNDSEMDLKIRYWVGKRDTVAAGGITDIRTGDDMAFTARPGDFFITQAGRSYWLTGHSDAVVRVRIDPPPLENGEPAEPIWIQLDQPHPYRFSATGCSRECLAFHRFGGGGITPLPRDLWIDDNNGPFPVDRDLAVR